MKNKVLLIFGVILIVVSTIIFIFGIISYGNFELGTLWGVRIEYHTDGHQVYNNLTLIKMNPDDILKFIGIDSSINVDDGTDLFHFFFSSNNFGEIEDAIFEKEQEALYGDPDSPNSFGKPVYNYFLVGTRNTLAWEHNILISWGSLIAFAGGVTLLAFTNDDSKPELEPEQISALAKFTKDSTREDLDLEATKTILRNSFSSTIKLFGLD